MQMEADTHDWEKGSQWRRASTGQTLLCDLSSLNSNIQKSLVQTLIMIKKTRYDQNDYCVNLREKVEPLDIAAISWQHCNLRNSIGCGKGHEKETLEKGYL